MKVSNRNLSPSRDDEYGKHGAPSSEHEKQDAAGREQEEPSEARKLFFELLAEMRI